VAGRRAGRRRADPAIEDAPTDGLPIVAIVGRPNVGKSTLFNRVVGRRQAVVEDRARTTRDRLYAVAEWNDRRFVVIDTGGMEVHPGDAIEEKVQAQARLAVSEADVILFVVDAAAGLTPADQETAETLRAARAPVIVVINKADNERLELEGAEFHRLGWSEAYTISALHGRATGDLLDALVWALPPESADEVARKERIAQAEAIEEAMEEARADVQDGQDEPDEAIVLADDPDRVPRIAIVGRPNVGKSSLLNALLGQERVIVSDIPGTTRDAIDTLLEWEGRTVRLVDTAGIRRRGKVASGPDAERFSALRALKAIGRADVCVLVVDATEGLAAQDAHVAGHVVDEGVGLVLAINKWDLVEEKTGRTFDEYVARLRADAPFLSFAPILSISAHTGQRVGRVLDAALAIDERRRKRIPTAALNKVVSDAVGRHPPPPVKGRRPRFFYATQAAIEPPTFVLFASGSDAVHFSYRRFLENRLREAFDFGGAPLRLVVRERSRVELEPRRRSKGRRKPARGASTRTSAGPSRRTRTRT
jgi:GTP-binding protein